MKVKLKYPDIRENYAKKLLNYKGIEDINRYLNPDIMCLNSPTNFENIEAGAELLKMAIGTNWNILLVVDSDNDGFTSSAIMYQYIKKIAPNINIQYRLHEGKQHGLEDHIDWILEHSEDIDMVILPDSSSNDFKYHEQLREEGIPCLVLDHHITDNEISSNAIIINNQLSHNYKNKELTGAGITWQFCRFCDNYFNVNFSKDLIDLAAWGIIGDMGSLLEIENRYIIKNGLENINNYFFKVLIEKQSYSMGGEITPITVAFYIVPLINAMIRVGTMEEKERLFMAFIDGHQMVPCNKRGAKGTFEEVAIESARECTNARTRQNKIKDETVQKLEMKIHKNGLLDNKVLFVRLEEDDQFPAVLNGLVAMQLSAKFKKPTIVARLNNEGYDRGSMRGLNQSELVSFKDFLEQSGYFEYVSGHDNAAGASIRDKDLADFHKYANEALKDIDFGENVYEVNFIRTAAEKDISNIIFDLDQYRYLYGQNIDEPLIYISDINLTKNDIQIIGKNADTVKFEKFGITYIKFHAKDLINELGMYNEMRVELVGRPNVNEWMGNYTPQIMIEDLEVFDSALDF